MTVKLAASPQFPGTPNLADRIVMGLEAVPASAKARPVTANAVVLALVAALLDLELCRTRGNVRRPMDRRRIA